GRYWQAASVEAHQNGPHESALSDRSEFTLFATSKRLLRLLGFRSNVVPSSSLISFRRNSQTASQGKAWSAPAVAACSSCKIPRVSIRNIEAQKGATPILQLSMKQFTHQMGRL